MGPRRIGVVSSNSQFLQALAEKLFAPMEGRMRAGRTSRAAGRLYRPTIYNIVRGPAVGPWDDAAETVRLPRSVTIVLAPEPPTRRIRWPRSSE